MVPKTTAYHHYDATHTSQGSQPIAPAKHTREMSSLTGSASAMCSSLIRRSLSSRGLSPRTIDIITESWRPNTRKQYYSAFTKWLHFCVERAVHPIQATVGQALDFLSSLYHGGAEYSTVNTTRSALSALLWSTTDSPVKFGSHPLVTRFMRGVFNLRPQLPRYSHIWDINILLSFLSRLEPIESIALKMLTYKLVCLCAVTTGQRAQTLSLIKLNNMTVQNNVVQINITDPIKTSRLGKPRPVVILSPYPHDNTLCVVRCLTTYVKRTKDVRAKKTKLFLSYVPPHMEVTTATISRWLKLSLTEAGVNTSVFKAHSIRSAATSKAANKGVSVDAILKTAGWTKASTFAKFYNRSIVKTQDEQVVFSNCILTDSV